MSLEMQVIIGVSMVVLTLVAGILYCAIGMFKDLKELKK